MSGAAATRAGTGIRFSLDSAISHTLRAGWGRRAPGNHLRAGAVALWALHLGRCCLCDLITLTAAAWTANLNHFTASTVTSLAGPVAVSVIYFACSAAVLAGLLLLYRSFAATLLAGFCFFFRLGDCFCAAASVAISCFLCYGRRSVRPGIIAFGAVYRAGATVISAASAGAAYALGCDGR